MNIYGYLRSVSASVIHCYNGLVPYLSAQETSVLEGRVPWLQGHVLLSPRSLYFA